MGSKNKISLVKQVSDKIDELFTPGRSKHDDKKSGSTGDKIYSYETRRAYKKHACYFVQWVKEQPIKPEIGHKPRTLDECRAYVPEWLQLRVDQGVSAWTIRLEASALAKLYGCTLKDFGVDLPARKRANITRSRGEKVRDYHFSEKRHSEFITFCKTTGLRSEGIQNVKGTDLIDNGDGTYCIDVTEKGGRRRFAPVFGEPEAVAAVVERMKSAGDGKVWPDGVPNGADIHSYRAAYATAIYKHHERDPKTLKRSEKYHCRTDLKGTVYDKRAMKIASEALGHSRIDVIASHYIRASEV